MLIAAAELIARNGYRAVNMTDIGSAVGISGSGVYRHFSSKSAILLALFDKVVDRLVTQAEEASKTLDDPQAVLDLLVREHIRFTMTERQLCLVYIQESRNLVAADLRRLRWKQRHYVDLWQEALGTLRPELTADEGQVVVHACIAGIHSALRYKTSLPDSELARRLELIAVSALGLPPRRQPTHQLDPAGS